MSKKKEEMPKDKLYAFMLNDKINFNIDELVTYIEDEYPSSDIYNVKRTYIHLQPNDNKLNSILSTFIISKAKELNECGTDVESCIKNNLSLFFEVSEKSNGIYIVEKVENN